MAYLCQPPHGGRRSLSDMLEQQQEPFLLDAYLMEKGYSDCLLPSHSTSVCWPLNPCGKLERITSHGLSSTRRRRRRRRSRGSQLLQCVLAKLLNGRALRKALNWDGSKVLHSSDADSKNGGDRCDRHSCPGIGDSSELDGVIEFERMGADDDLELLSPVSVLQKHLHEASPLQLANSKEDLPSLIVDFKDFFELAYSPPLNYFGKSRGHLVEPDNPLQNSAQDGKGSIFGQEAAENISQLTSSDISNSRCEWSEFQPQVREIGVQIEAAILEDIREDAILEMLGFHYFTFLRSN